MEQFQIATEQKRQVVDITDEVERRLPEGNGVAVIFVQHTTAAVTLADLDPGTDQDFLDFLAAVTPKLKWRHPHDPAHAPDHLLASLVGPSISVPYENRQLLLGSWQRIVLLEFDGPRDRQLVVAAL